MKKILIFSVFLLIAGLIFYGCFFCLAPFICGNIPVGEWKGLLDIVVYGLIAWFGGVGIPLAIVVIGIGVSIHID